MAGIEDKIILEQGDLTEAEVDAIVNAANNELLLGGGVAGAIRNKGGAAIQDECDKLSPIGIGEAAMTSGGRLKARHVIHAASMSLGGRTTGEALRMATRHALQLAAEHGVKTIALPAIGTGIAGFPMKECAEIMLDEVVQHLKGKTSLEQVRFVLLDRPALESFQQVWREMRRKGLA